MFARLQDPVHARALENYIRHIIAMEPPMTPIFTSYRRKDGSTIRLRLDWSYDRSVSGVTIGLISVVTPVSGWPEHEARAASGGGADERPQAPAGDRARRPGGDAYSRVRLLQQTLHAARVWASIMAHRHPEGDDAQIVAKVDDAIGEALRMLGSDRRAPIAASSYYEEPTPLHALVVGVVEPVTILRASLLDLLRSWGCHPVGIERPADTIDILAKTGRVPDMIIADLEAAIGLGADSVVRAVWRRYGARHPLHADRRHDRPGDREIRRVRRHAGRAPAGPSDRAQERHAGAPAQRAPPPPQVARRALAPPATKGRMTGAGRRVEAYSPYAPLGPRGGPGLEPLEALEPEG